MRSTLKVVEFTCSHISTVSHIVSRSSLRTYPWSRHSSRPMTCRVLALKTTRYCASWTEGTYPPRMIPPRTHALRSFPWLPFSPPFPVPPAPPVPTGARVSGEAEVTGADTSEVGEEEEEGGEEASLTD